MDSWLTGPEWTGLAIVSWGSNWLQSLRRTVRRDGVCILLNTILGDIVSHRARLSSARQLLYLDKQLVTFNGIHCAPGYAYVRVCVQRNFSHCSAALSPILHTCMQLYIFINLYNAVCLYVWRAMQSTPSPRCRWALYWLAPSVRRSVRPVATVLCTN